MEWNYGIMFEHFYRLESILSLPLDDMEWNYGIMFEHFYRLKSILSVPLDDMVVKQLMVHL